MQQVVGKLHVIFLDKLIYTVGMVKFPGFGGTKSKSSVANYNTHFVVISLIKSYFAMVLFFCKTNVFLCF
jgi:hypothetical protein